MASPARSILPRLEPTASLRQPATLTDDVLEEIFLRVASHADLARASAACVSFRRLIANRNFLRRFRSRHPPLLLGFLGGVGHEVFQPVEAPHPNAPVARALYRAGVFSFDYLPDCGEPGWSLSDVSDGRLLLEAEGSRVHGNGANRFAWPDLAVCDPLSRQYLLLPRMPEDLLASVQIKEREINHFDDSLVPSGDWEETSFRVLRMVLSRTTLVVLVFSSTSGCWSVGPSTTWDVLSFHVPPREPVLGRPQFAYGCCYRKLTYLSKLLKLDMNTMELSTVDLPPNNESHSIAIVEAGEGNLGMFNMIYNINEVTSVDYHIFGQNLSGRANEWHIKKTTTLPDCCLYQFIGSAQGYVFLVRIPTSLELYNWSQSRFEYVCFSLESKTSNIERVSGMGSSVCYLYFGFPSFLSPRRIQLYDTG
ncbi:unnamed protein product [Urochloa decumbens]|uniref:F-box domain-containing protein n=1 Tax=Urochloa decumbens TaxID=240449 RepID=A0ABC9G1K0_9POAL